MSASEITLPQKTGGYFEGHSPHKDHQNHNQEYQNRFQDQSNHQSYRESKGSLLGVILIILEEIPVFLGVVLVVLVWRGASYTLSQRGYF